MNRCFADKEKECSALNIKVCERNFDWKSKKFNYYDCNFYKSQEQHKADNKKANKRIKSLDEDTKDNIISFYGLEEL